MVVRSGSDGGTASFGFTLYCLLTTPNSTLRATRMGASIHTPIDSYIETNRGRFLDELKSFLSIPSVSTLPQHRPDIDRASEFVAGKLREAGIENVERIATSGHPLIYGDWMHAPGKPTVLCYGHYDVQPPDPLAEWTSPPFQPSVRGESIYARGAADDKGQMYIHVKAAESLLKAR